MAQKGCIDKARLLLKHGAEIDPIDEEYQSTPLGLASRWGQREMVEFLLESGADPGKAGAAWATPLEWAKRKGHPDIEATLRSRTPVKSSRSRT
jgi:ankyrin repeat protein